MRMQQVWLLGARGAEGWRGGVGGWGLVDQLFALAPLVGTTIFHPWLCNLNSEFKLLEEGFPKEFVQRATEVSPVIRVAGSTTADRPTSCTDPKAFLQSGCHGSAQ